MCLAVSDYVVLMSNYCIVIDLARPSSCFHTWLNSTSLTKLQPKNK